MISRALSLARQLPLEAIVWVFGLTALTFADPGHSHFTLCPFKNLGFDFCPGCGLGTSITFFLHGEIVLSLKTHPLGIPAFFILIFRIVTLTKQYLKTWHE